MAICNRGLDASEQKRTFSNSFPLTGTGVTLPILMVPFNSELQAARLSAVGLSGAPTFDLRIQRFIAGAGVTILNPGTTTLTATAVGTSGIQTVLLAASGSSLVQLLAGDLLTLTTGAANTACAALSVAVVIQALQDIKTQFGV